MKLKHDDWISRRIEIQIRLSNQVDKFTNLKRLIVYRKIFDSLVHIIPIYIETT